MNEHYIQSKKDIIAEHIFLMVLHVRVTALMEAISDELRTYSKGRSLIKFTTVYPALVLTGIAKKPRIRYFHITILI